MLLLLMVSPLVIFAGENAALDPVARAMTQNDSAELNLRRQTDFLQRWKSNLLSDNRRGEETALPYVISMPKPIPYPRWARREGFQGRLVIAIEVLEDGSVGRWRIEKSTGDEKLDKTSVDSILTWKFHPAMEKGRPVKTCIEVPINFELIRD